MSTFKVDMSEILHLPTGKELIEIIAEQDGKIDPTLLYSTFVRVYFESIFPNPSRSYRRAAREAFKENWMELNKPHTLVVLTVAGRQYLQRNSGDLN